MMRPTNKPGARRRHGIPTALFLAILVSLAWTLALLADNESPASESKTGFLIPSQCQPREGATPPKGPYDAWPAPHTTECALEEACIASGYGLWVMEDKSFYRFDEAGQGIALDYFRTTKRTSYNKVEILGNFTDTTSVRIDKMTPTD